ncbi:nuclear transport factor 2 family protein [Tunicatimonas pelagia]|uniref:nuclear transport factor 2 family protein n=1 Tax=Tunicatimonas pelagia TaxID=931531 RepID=UPI00266614E1|nr:nuclear transport factor 2 family protein [Tunicatimonas pelagia]WKN42766.1 nuclear transport factor 2 family protein [Tunicatimonas pelagia]
MENLEETLDKIEVFQMAYKFADAANRKDGEMFQCLWDHQEAEWAIGPPINVSFSGREQMGTSLVHMLNRWEFFVQMVSGGVVEIHSTRAYARFYVHEVANARGGGGNNNLSMYEDELVKREGLWFFTKRTYHTVFQSAERQAGEVIAVPEIPTWIREASLASRQ